MALLGWVGSSLWHLVCNAYDGLMSLSMQKMGRQAFGCHIHPVHVEIASFNRVGVCLACLSKGFAVVPVVMSHSWVAWAVPMLWHGPYVGTFHGYGDLFLPGRTAKYLSGGCASHDEGGVPTAWDLLRLVRLSVLLALFLHCTLLYPPLLLAGRAGLFTEVSY